MPHDWPTWYRQLDHYLGWLKDRFGLSWQIVPSRFVEMMRDKDPKRSQRVMQAMLTMKKFDIARLEQAYAQA